MRATADSWQHMAMPVQSEPLVVERRYSGDEYDLIAEGSVPRSQDDRWFIWLDDDGVVHINRSWTGMAVFEAHLVASGDGWEIREAYVNPEAAEYSKDRTISGLLLGEILDSLARR